MSIHNAPQFPGKEKANNPFFRHAMPFYIPSFPKPGSFVQGIKVVVRRWRIMGWKKKINGDR